MSESLSGQPSDSTSQNPVPPAGEVPFELSQEPVTPEGPHAEPAADAVPAPAYEHLGELPATYGTQSVYLVAYDPRQLFTYWDVDWSSAPDAKYALRVCRQDGEQEGTVDISAADTGRYIPIGKPGGTYYVELGTRGRDGSFQLAALSGRVTMPPEGLSGELEPKFATLPFHLSFQRLLELIQNAMGTGEDLTAALARLQQGDRPQVAALLNQIGHLNGEQLHTLETLLGKHLDVEGGASPTGGSEQHFLRDRADVAPLAAGGSENLSSGAFGSENLSSGAFSSESLSSGGFGSEIALPSAALGSEIALPSAALGSESLSSGAFGSERPLAGLAFGSEALSSSALGLGNLNSELLFAGGLSSAGLSSGEFGSEAWRMAQGGLGGGSDLLDSERADLFRRAMGNNLDVLGSLFSAFGSPGASDGFSAGYW